MLTHISQLNEHLPKQAKKLALAAAHDPHALGAVMHAYHKNVIQPILVGNQTEIEKTALGLNLSLENIEIYPCNTTLNTVHTSVELVSNGKADILMKGRLQTPELLKGVLNKTWGLQTGNKLSHVALFESEKYHKLFAVTDVAMNSAPDLEAKIHILNNAVHFMQSIGIELPKVAALAAIEKINPKMQATLDAQALMQLNKKGEIKACDVLGPIAFDGAMSKSIAKDKGIDHPVAGDADILLVPNIETGNVLYKCLNLFSEVKVAAIILGAQAPIVLTSRSDSEDTKFNSILLAASTC